MQAVTTMRCLESFSLERMELLGDSVLKYAVSSHLFVKYDKKHEGQLTARRSWAICNASLHRVATLHNLPVLACIFLCPLQLSCKLNRMN
jgi:endoribonuclease Dicer